VSQACESVNPRTVELLYPGFQGVGDQIHVSSRSKIRPVVMVRIATSYNAVVTSVGMRLRPHDAQCHRNDR
jgi:hypothetical protein